MATGIYNINIDPLVSEANKINVDRDITFSSSSIHFLQSFGFNLQTCVTDGVTYLSRAEQAKAIFDYGKRIERLANPTAQLIATIDPYNHEVIAFVRHATNEIQAWIDGVAVGTATTDYVNVDIPGGDQTRYYQKLMYDLIRAKFTGYRTYHPHAALFMTVEKVRPQREAAIAAGKQTVFEAALKKETGFRWIIEALSPGGDISGIDPTWFAVSHDGNSMWIDSDGIKRELTEIADIIKSKSRVLVGHNIFMDLAFLYQTFIGDLPESVVDFQAAIHELFPNIMDTKFIATTKGHAGYQDSSSLEELHNKYKNTKEPVIDVPEKFSGYMNKEKLHEAGYDSYICAQVFVRMVSQMQKANEGISSHIGSFDPMTGMPVWTSAASLAPFKAITDLEDVKFKEVRSKLTCGPGTPIGSNPIPGGPYNLVNGQQRNTAFIFDINHEWYKQYMGKLRVFRCEETVCDFNIGPEKCAEMQAATMQITKRPAPHSLFRGPSADVRNYKTFQQAPQQDQQVQPPQNYFSYGQHAAQLGPIAGSLGTGFHSYRGDHRGQHHWYHSQIPDPLDSSLSGNQNQGYDGIAGIQYERGQGYGEPFQEGFQDDQNQNFQGLNRGGHGRGRRGYRGF